MTIITFVLFVLILSFDLTQSATQCYFCNPCGSTWATSGASIIQTSSSNDYCRKTTTGSLIVRDSSPTCNPLNFANNGVFCCQDNLCNKSPQTFLQVFLLGLTMFFLWIIY